MSESALLIVSAEVLPGREDDFNEWYDEHHIPLFSGKFPRLKSVKRFHSHKSNQEFIAIYEFGSHEDLDRALSSQERKDAKDDSSKQIGILVKSFSSNTYSQVYPK